MKEGSDNMGSLCDAGENLFNYIPVIINITKGGRIK